MKLGVGNRLARSQGRGRGAVETPSGGLVNRCSYHRHRTATGRHRSVSGPSGTGRGQRHVMEALMGPGPPPDIPLRVSMGFSEVPSRCGSRGTIRAPRENFRSGRGEPLRSEGTG